MKKPNKVQACKSETTLRSSLRGNGFSIVLREHSPKKTRFFNFESWSYEHYISNRYLQQWCNQGISMERNEEIVVKELQHFSYNTLVTTLPMLKFVRATFCCIDNTQSTSVDYLCFIDKRDKLLQSIIVIFIITCRMYRFTDVIYTIGESIQFYTKTEIIDCKSVFYKYI